MCNVEKIYMLADEWETLNSLLYVEEFNYESFQNTAKGTFEILFEYKDDDMISKDLLGLIIKINIFGENPMSCIEEADAAKLVAKEFCNQFLECWVGTENGVDKDVFIVAAENGVDCFIDTETFDLSELVDNGLGIV